METRMRTNSSGRSPPCTPAQRVPMVTRCHLTDITTSPESVSIMRQNTNDGLVAIDLARRNLTFEMGDFYVSRRFKSFVQQVIVPDGLIQSRLERMAECIMRDLNAEGQELSIVVTQDNSLKFYRDLQKKLTQRSANTQFRAYQIKETYVRTGPQAVERVWKIVGLKPGTTDIVANPIEAIQGKNVLLLATLIDKGTTVERLFNSLAKFNPKNLKVAVAF